MISTTLSFRVMETACHPSYPLNSENARPPGTLTVYLSCAEMAKEPRTANHVVAIPIVSTLDRFIADALMAISFSRHSSMPATLELLDEGSGDTFVSGAKPTARCFEANRPPTRDRETSVSHDQS